MASSVVTGGSENGQVYLAMQGPLFTSCVTLSRSGLQFLHHKKEGKATLPIGCGRR